MLKNKLIVLHQQTFYIQSRTPPGNLAEGDQGISTAVDHDVDCGSQTSCTVSGNQAPSPGKRPSNRIPTYKKLETTA
jgi:hypothetical protein